MGEQVPRERSGLDRLRYLVGSQAALDYACEYYNGQYCRGQDRATLVSPFSGYTLRRGGALAAALVAELFIREQCS
jgi:hypothetical protein